VADAGRVVTTRANGLSKGEGGLRLNILVAGVVVLSAATTVALTVPTADAAPPLRANLLALMHRDLYFSPNGDGAGDRERVVFRLDQRAFVTVLVRDHEGTTVRRAALGVQEDGRHVWRWNGRSNSGRRVPDGYYRVVLRTAGENRTERDETSVHVITEPDAGRLVLSRDTVYPAADATVDSLSVAYVRAKWSEDERLYSFYFGDRPIRLTARFVVVDEKGDRVLSRSSTKYTPTLAWTARNAAGRPLASGTYILRVKVTDEVGNARTFRRTVVVSAAQLDERVWSATIPAASADQGPGPVLDPSCLGCGEVCGPVLSDRFPGGLSFRQPCDFGYAAVRYFAAPAPVVPAPVDAFRVTATGGPTTPGDTDTAKLAGLVLGPGDASVTTPWEDVDLDAYPYLPDAQRPLTWDVSTSDQNDYDIASFTLEYRYYVPAT
jgi:hypothetical protein